MYTDTAAVTMKWAFSRQKKNANINGLPVEFHSVSLYSVQQIIIEGIFCTGMHEYLRIEIHK